MPTATTPRDEERLAQQKLRNLERGRATARRNRETAVRRERRRRETRLRALERDRERAMERYMRAVETEKLERAEREQGTVLRLGVEIGRLKEVTA